MTTTSMATTPSAATAAAGFWRTSGPCKRNAAHVALRSRVSSPFWLSSGACRCWILLTGDDWAISDSRGWEGAGLGSRVHLVNTLADGTIAIVTDAAELKVNSGTHPLVDGGGGARLQAGVAARQEAHRDILLFDGHARLRQGNNISLQFTKAPDQLLSSRGAPGLWLAPVQHPATSRNCQGNFKATLIQKVTTRLCVAFCQGCSPAASAAGGQPGPWASAVRCRCHIQTAQLPPLLRLALTPPLHLLK